MTRDHQHTPDPNENDAQIVAGPEARAAAEAHTDVDAAWVEWTGHIQKVEEQTLSLLRTAFEAGFEAGRRGE